LGDLTELKKQIKITVSFPPAAPIFPDLSFDLDTFASLPVTDILIDLACTICAPFEVPGDYYVIGGLGKMVLGFFMT
jgi:hypothetical protein